MEYDKIFTRLKLILEPYEPSLTVVHDNNNNYYLNTPTTDKNKKAEFFAAVQMKKSYISFHLMPVYYNPNLLDNASEDLQNRMQGKSCFNFKNINEGLFSELRLLTKNAFDEYKALQKV